MPTPTDAIGAAAQQLLDMRRTHRIERDLAPGLRPDTLEQAYAIQDQVVDGLLPTGATRIGFKVACTNRIAQAALLIDGPMFGQLLSHSSSPSGVTLSTADFVHRVVEAEIALRIGTDVEPVAGGHTRDSIAEHIDAVIPAIEIVDHRFESWTIGALPVTADNAIHGWWVHGAPDLDWRRLDLAATRVIVRRNGEVVTTGSGAAVLGHPLTVMAWLADELPRFGRALRAGDVVSTGVTTDVFEAAAGDHIVAEFAGIGIAELHFD
jgi:2-keto-4-pentenoate hydratase